MAGRFKYLMKKALTTRSGKKITRYFYDSAKVAAKKKARIAERQQMRNALQDFSKGLKSGRLKYR